MENRIVPSLSMNLIATTTFVTILVICSCSSPHVASRLDDQSYYKEVTSSFANKETLLGEIENILNRLPNRGDIGQVNAEYLIKKFEFQPKSPGTPQMVWEPKIYWKEIKQVKIGYNDKKLYYYLILVVPGVVADISNIKDKNNAERLGTLILKMHELCR